jgi:hypothetical protein
LCAVSALIPMAQIKPSNSRPTAAITTPLFLPLPYLQPATVDPLAKTATRGSQGLDSENCRVRKIRNRHAQHRLKRQTLSRATKTNLRETFLHSFFSKGAGSDVASREPFRQAAVSKFPRAFSATA